MAGFCLIWVDDRVHLYWVPKADAERFMFLDNRRRQSLQDGLSILDELERLDKWSLDSETFLEKLRAGHPLLTFDGRV